MSFIDNKRLAKNSLFLYIRTLVLMIISLYTSRIVLQALGETDYGIYAVVGGVVMLFTFVNTALSGATQRFLNIALGSGNETEIKRVFDTSIQIHIAIALLFVLLSETVGLWFVSNELNIEESKIVATQWIYQFSIVTTAINVISSPYNALIVSHERMSAFAYISIMEGALKLIVAFVLINATCNRLILYGALLCVVSMTVRFMYGRYCSKRFHECNHISLKIDRCLIIKMSGFSFWSLFGSIGHLASTQGMAIVINIFFGTIVNAALSIANQVNSAAYQTISGFLQAVKPQLMKSYSGGEISQLRDLIYRSSKMAMLLTSLFVFPLIICIEFILSVWLNEVPVYTAGFVRIMLLMSYVNSFMLILTSVQDATGRIKYFQLVTISASLICIPLSWILYKRGFSPYYGLVTNLILSVISQLIRLCFVRRSIGLSFRLFATKVIFRSSACVLISLVIPFMLWQLWPDDVRINIISGVICFFMLLISIFCIGLDKAERKKIYILSHIKKEI